MNHDLSLENFEEGFAFLDALRESGMLNMWAAGPSLARMLEMPEKQSRSIHIGWMRSFDPEIDSDARARAAFENYQKEGENA